MDNLTVISKIYEVCCNNDYEAHTLYVARWGSISSLDSLIHGYITLRVTFKNWIEASEIKLPLSSAQRDCLHWIIEDDALGQNLQTIYRELVDSHNPSEFIATLEKHQPMITELDSKLRAYRKSTSCYICRYNDHHD